MLECQTRMSWEFPAGLQVRTPHSHSQQPGVPSLVEELRSCKPSGVAKKEKKNKIY